MNRLRHARIACMASMAWSAIFIVIEITAKAYAYAFMQAALFIAGAALCAFYTRLIAKARTTLPAPAAASDTSRR